MRKLFTVIFMILFLFTSASFVFAETPYKDLLDKQVNVICYEGVYNDVTYIGYTDGIYVFRTKDKDYGEFLVFQDARIKDVVPITVSTD